MTRAELRLSKLSNKRKYSAFKIAPPPVVEFDAEPKTRPIPPETMAQLVATAVRS